MGVISTTGTGRGGSVQLDSSTTTVRQTPRTDFGTMVRNGVATGAGAVAGATSVAAPFVPGGAVVSAAVNGAASSITGGGYNADGTQYIPGTGPTMSDPTGSSTGATSSAGSQQQLLDQTKAMQEMQMSFSLQYLQLQEKMQGENRQFTTISNVMKTKHDTAKSTINNVR
ncbi:MAG: hypothetical protein JXR83_10690 [Deltaproteobacteria bacterium]|nr:hypothetical protein [Deltaproteobacteria bacterium]